MVEFESVIIQQHKNNNNNKYNPPPPNQAIPVDKVDIIHEAHKNDTFLSEKQLKIHIKAIRDSIRREEKILREKYSWLANQDFLGGLCFIVSLLAMIAIGVMYYKKIIGFWVTIPLIALPVSILHELEHDLIHNLYFKSKKWVQDVMFFTIWFSKFSINPWYRKQIHLRHHIYSGQKQDIEERFIGLGLPLGVFRALLTLYPFANILLFPPLKKDNRKDFNPAKVTMLGAPTIIPFTVVLHIFIEYCRLHMGWTFGTYDPANLLPAWGWTYARDAAALILLPNILRQACLNILASYSHYYGDIPRNNVYYQNQILDHWLLTPLQFLSFNFGKTHIIHHFVWNQPFYLRQWISNKVNEVLVKHGIRRNDFGIIRRANRFFENGNAHEQSKEIEDAEQMRNEQLVDTESDNKKEE